MKEGPVSDGQLIFFGGLFGALVMMILACFTLIPSHASVPQCQEDEVVTVQTYLWIKKPDKCVNREDANFEFGYWTSSK